MLMEEIQEFDAVLQVGEQNGAYVKVPFDVQQVYGTRGLVKIKATIDGEEYRGSLANKGMGCHILIVLKAIRAKIGKQHGDTVHITLRRDTEERTIAVPEDLQQAFLTAPAAKSTFDNFAYSHRK